MRRLTLMIPDDAAVRLVCLAQAERRDPRDQGALLLTRALDRIAHPDAGGPAPTARPPQALPAGPRPRK